MSTNTIILNTPDDPTANLLNNTQLLLTQAEYLNVGKDMAPQQELEEVVPEISEFEFFTNMDQFGNINNILLILLGIMLIIFLFRRF